MMKLLSATPSPYARKVRIALIEKALPFELLTEVPWNAGASTPKYNPLETLPVLILDDGSTVYFCSAGCAAIFSADPGPYTAPSDPSHRPSHA